MIFNNYLCKYNIYLLFCNKFLIIINIFIVSYQNQFVAMHIVTTISNNCRYLHLYLMIRILPRVSTRGYCLRPFGLFILYFTFITLHFALNFLLQSSCYQLLLILFSLIFAFSLTNRKKTVKFVGFKQNNL